MTRYVTSFHFPWKVQGIFILSEESSVWLTCFSRASLLDLTRNDCAYKLCKWCKFTCLLICLLVSFFEVRDRCNLYDANKQDCSRLIHWSNYKLHALTNLIQNTGILHTDINQSFKFALCGIPQSYPWNVASFLMGLGPSLWLLLPLMTHRHDGNNNCQPGSSDFIYSTCSFKVSSFQHPILSAICSAYAAGK